MQINIYLEANRIVFIYNIVNNIQTLLIQVF